MGRRKIAKTSAETATVKTSKKYSATMPFFYLQKKKPVLIFLIIL